MEQELNEHLKLINEESKRRERNNVLNTSISALIGASLGYWAWQTIAHAVFSFALFFVISAVGNRITDELFRIGAQQKASNIMAREKTPVVG